MKATSIRNNKNEVISTELALKIERELSSRFEKKGFITKVEVLTRTTIKIGLHMCSFRIDTHKLGSNARVGSNYANTKKGYVRTSVPTWQQRVEFNNIINNVFDKYKLNASIKSGPFTVRDKKLGRYTEVNWSQQDPSGYGDGSMINGFGMQIGKIVSEKDAISMKPF